MNYVGTRGFAGDKTFAGALLDGLAPDGGLYVPAEWPTPGFDLSGDYGTLTQNLLTLFGVDVLGADAVKAAAERTRAAFLRDGEVPLTQLADNRYRRRIHRG